MKNWRRATIWAVALVLSGCRGEQGPAFVVRDSTGIRLVENDFGQPAWGIAGRWRLAEQPMLQLGNVPGDLAQQLYRVNHSIRLSSGPIAVANTGLGDIRIFDESGFMIRQMRVTPVGAENAVAPVRVHELAGDSLLVFLTDRSVAVFDSEGRLRRRSQPIATDVESDPSPELIGILNDGSLVMRSHPPQQLAASGIVRTEVELRRYRSDGSFIASIGRFPNRTLLGGDDVLVFAPVGQQALADSTIWYGAGDGVELYQVDINHNPRQIIRLNRPPNRVTAVDSIGYRKAAVNTIGDTLDEATALRVVESYHFPESFPAYSDMIVDRVGNVWLRGYHWYDVGAPLWWTVFDPEGRFLGELQLPALMEVHDIGDRYVLGRMAANRAEGVYMYEINKPETQPRLTQAVP